jgi:hypothetical protein
MAREPLSIPAGLGVSPDLLALISGHRRATRAWVAASTKADRCKFRAFRQSRKAGASDAKILRAHGWPALNKVQRKASDEMDRIEFRCIRFRARTAGDLAAKLLFAAYHYDLGGSGIDGLAVTSAISDAVRLAKKGGAA